MTIAILLAALLGAVVTFNRGCGLPFGLPSLPRWAKVVLAGLAAAAMTLPLPHGEGVGGWIGLLLVGLATAGAFAMGHSIWPGDRPALVLNLLDMQPGWQRGIWEGAISGGLLVLPVAVLIFATTRDVSPAALALAGGMAKPLCYWLGGKVWPRPAHEPDNVASALHGLTCWGAIGLAVLAA